MGGKVGGGGNLRVLGGRIRVVIPIQVLTTYRGFQIPGIRSSGLEHAVAGKTVFGQDSEDTAVD